MSEATAKVSTSIHASTAEVWHALTTPAELKSFFFGADVDSDFKVGSPVTMKGEFKGKPYEDKGEVLTADPNRRLAFSHYSPLTGAPDAPENYHVVTFDLTPKGRDTQVTLTQSNLTGGVKPADREHRAEYEKNWQGVLDGLARLFPN